MKKHVRIPLRRKILFSVMLGLTGTVGLITFTMARFFHEDKQAYINDWITTATVSTADDCHSLLEGYVQRLLLHSEIMLNEDLSQSEKQRLMQRFFDEMPELVDISVYRGGKVIETATDSNSLDAAGIGREELLKFREAHPLPVERIAAGEIYVFNSTVSAGVPTMTLAVARAGQLAAGATPGAQPGEEFGMVAAEIRLDELLRVGSRFPVFEVTIADAEGHVLAHPDRTQVAQRREAEFRPEAAGLDDSSRVGTTVEFDRQGIEMLAGFAPVDIGGVTVTALIPKSAAYLASRELLGRLLLVALGLILIVALASLLWASRLTGPVERLSLAAGMIAKGEFDVQVEVSSGDEIGALAGSFNQMATELSNREEALQTAHKQLIQSEKMAAFGQLGAGIAHEVKNPLAGILGCAQLSLLELESGEDVTERLKLIEKETKRCKDIIDSLMRFARQEKAEMSPTDINAVIEDATSIVNHQMQINQVQLVKEITPNLMPIHGNGNQLEQVVINLLINAQQAMDGQPGTITVTTHQPDPATIELRVQDSGPGIPEEVQQKLFDPFFSTKPPGKGTGLGLSVSFGIVRDHDGQITVESEMGQGATFVLRFPAMVFDAMVEEKGTDLFLLQK